MKAINEKGEMLKKKIIIRCLSVAGIVALIWVGSIVKYEALTLSHGDEFTNGYKATNMIDSVDGFKVLEYSDSHARIYYFTYDKESGGIGFANGNYISFVKEDGKWELSEWDYQRWDDYVQWPYLFFTFGGRVLTFFIVVPVIVMLFLLKGSVKKEKAIKGISQLG